MRYPAFLLALCSLVILAACGGNLTGSVTPPEGEQEQQEQEQPAEETQQDDGSKDGDFINIPGFSVPGRYMETFGEYVMMFQYPTAEDAGVDAAKVSADGHFIEGVEIPWEGPVHFFQRGEFIAVYVGGNEEILNGLTRNGEESQFAGD